MKNAAFTICSHNYLAQAGIALRTFKANHLDYYTHLIIVDEPIDIDLTRFERYTYIHELNIKDFEHLVDKYNVVELSTAVKPSVFKYLFHRGYDSVTYIDPDTYFFSQQKEVESLLKRGIPIIITPHALSPIDDELPYTDYNIMRFGIFNLGYIAIGKSEVSYRFLDWWESRLKKYGYARSSLGMFTDQMWINHVPVFFPEAHILRKYNYNVSYWNLHERTIKMLDNVPFIEESNEPLVFYHFSHYKPEYAERIVYSFEIRYNFENRKDITELYESYRIELIQNDYEYLSKIKYSLKRPDNSLKNKLRNLKRRIF